MSLSIEFLTLNLSLVFVFVLLSICCTFTRDVVRGIEIFFVFIFGASLASFFLAISFKSFLPAVLLIALTGVIFTFLKTPSRLLYVVNDLKYPQLAIMGIVNIAFGLLRLWKGADNTYFQDSSFRFADLAVDNALPAIAANSITGGSLPDPLVPGWQLSDRPPLQTGFLIITSLNRQVSWNYYFIFSLLAQSLIFWAIFYWVRCRKYSNSTQLFSLVILGFTSFVVQNIIFPWPKLFGAAFLIVALSIYLQKREYNSDTFTAPMLLSASTLSHSSHFFIVVPILFYSLLNINAGLKQKFIAFSIFLFSQLPWLLFQKVVLPPGDRLLKLHFAGIKEENQRSFLELFIKKYSELSWGEWIQFRISNVLRSIIPYLDPDNPFKFGEQGTFKEGSHRLLGTPFPLNSFDSRLWTITELTVLSSTLVYMAIWIMWVKFRENHKQSSMPSEKSTDKPLAWLLSAAYMLWVILMFDPNSTVLWQFTIAFPIILYCQFLPRLIEGRNLRTILQGIFFQILIFLNIWVRKPISPLMEYHFNSVGMLWIVAGLICILLVLRSIKFSFARKSMETEHGR